MSSYITANVYRLKLNTTFNSNWENLRMSPKKGILIFGIPLKKNTRFSQKFGFLLIFFFRNSEFYSKKKFRFRNSGKSEFMTEPLFTLFDDDIVTGGFWGTNTMSGRYGQVLGKPV